MVRKIAAIPPVLGNRISPNQNRSGKPQQVCYCIYFISSCRMIRTVYYISSLYKQFHILSPAFLQRQKICQIFGTYRKPGCVCDDS